MDVWMDGWSISLKQQLLYPQILYAILSSS
jgi:hypothetical protein